MSAHALGSLVIPVSSQRHSSARWAKRGAAASWTFTGSRITWWTVTGPGQGKADVYVDGEFVATLNNYAPAMHYMVAQTIINLANTSHTIRIVVRGENGATNAKGSFVSIDAFSVGTQRTNTPALKATWRLLTNSAFSYGHAMAATLTGETFTFTFRGTGISWFTEKARNQGKVAVYVDGVYRASSTTTRPAPASA